MNIIAFDTATDSFALGLAINADKPEEQRFLLEISGAKKHSTLIMDGTDTLLRLAAQKKQDLGAVACMEGPGSFTGLRIGFATAKGLALALGIHLIPVPTLDCMASPLTFWPGLVIPLIDAKKNAFFTAIYHKGERIGDFMDTGLNELVSHLKSIDYSPSLLITGPAANLAFPVLSAEFAQAALDPAYNRTHASDLLNLAKKSLIMSKEKSSDGNKTGEALDCGPLYLRKSDAEIKLLYG